MCEHHDITTPDKLDAYLRDKKASEVDQDEEVQYVNAVVVRVDGQLYAFSAEGLKQVSRVESIAPIPGCPKVIAGLASVGGAIIGVVDASELLGTSDQAAGRQEHVLVYEHAEEHIGFSVSAVEDVARIPASAFSELDRDQGSSLVTAEVRYADQCMPYVDVHEGLSNLLGEEMHP